MSAPGSARRTLVAVAVMVVLGGAPAPADGGTPVGGTVESTLALSLGEPSPFSRVRGGHKESVYDATIAAEVTATDAPVRLSLADGEAISGARRGHMVRGRSILAVALRGGKRTNGCRLPLARRGRGPGDRAVGRTGCAGSGHDPAAPGGARRPPDAGRRLRQARAGDRHRRGTVTCGAVKSPRHRPPNP
jgi:hypothetical protein